MVAGTSWYKCQPHMGPTELKEGSMASPTSQLGEGIPGTQGNHVPPIIQVGDPWKSHMLISLAHFPRHPLLFILSSVTLSGLLCYLCLAYF